MQHEDKKLLDIVNRSGFPFQIAIANFINHLKTEQEWAVLHCEHAWQNAANEDSGFIDLVVQSKNRRQVLVIECKRDASDVPWIFFASDFEGKPRRHAKLYFNTASPAVQDSYWGDGLMDPAQCEAQFCVVQGRDEKGRISMLERDAGTLVSATEAFAREEADLAQALQIPIRIYASMLVTTAKLMVCEANLEDISLRDGKLSDAKMHEKSCVRFRKQIDARASNRSIESFGKFEDMAYAKEHTVLVVNINDLGDLLAELELARWP
ncbi:MAG: hypothetical protein ABUS47_16195 [Steroidobacter sp.]